MALERLPEYHGKCKSPAYQNWCRMKARCYQEGNNRFHAYGAIGVTVCERWLHSFSNFLADMGERPSPKHSLDRYPNTKGNYEPGNVRWATAKMSM